MKAHRESQSALVAVVWLLGLGVPAAAGAADRYVCLMPIAPDPQLRSLSHQELADRLATILLIRPDVAERIRRGALEKLAVPARKANPGHEVEVDGIAGEIAASMVAAIEAEMERKFTQAVHEQINADDLPALLTFYQNPANRANSKRIAQLQANPALASQQEADDIEQCSRQMLAYGPLARMLKLTFDQIATMDLTIDRLAGQGADRLRTRLVTAKLRLPAAGKE